MFEVICYQLLFVMQEEYMEYHRYLKEVVEALESDPQFREKLEKANENDIRVSQMHLLLLIKINTFIYLFQSGKIAHELEFVNHNVRTKLDEIKRNELERLRHLIKKKGELENGLNHPNQAFSKDPEPDLEHVDVYNHLSFEIEDLKKLILKSTKVIFYY